MTAQPLPPFSDRRAHPTFVDEPDDESARPNSGPVQTDGSQRRPSIVGSLSSPRLATIVGGLSAVLVGGCMGYWLGRRPEPRRLSGPRRTASRVESAMELAPVALKLLANPLVRAMLIRALARRLGP